MPAATNKSDLIAVTGKEYAKLDQLLDQIDAEDAGRKDDEDTSIRDVIAHRAHWVGLFLGWYADGMAGKTLELPAPGYKWNDLKRYNAMLRKKYAHLDWPDARARLASAHEQLLAWMQGHSQDELYGGPMPGGGNTWTPGRWAEAAGPSHYRSAAKHIRARLREIRA